MAGEESMMAAITLPLQLALAALLGIALGADMDGSEKLGLGEVNKPSLKATPPPAWKLVWADEFNTNGAPDPKSWQYETGFMRNHELQWYQPDNARCEGGMLIIEARKERRPNPRYQPGSTNWKTNREYIDYTSASLNTGGGLHQWQYGRFEMRARINTSPGMWPAFWTLGVSRQWPSNGEIDIMEYYKEKLLANVAVGTAKPYTAKWFSTSKPMASFQDPDWSKNFHVWRMDWDAEAVRLYVDDLLLNEVKVSDTVNQDGTGFNPMQQPHYVLLNLAIGGDNGGDPTPTIFPNRYEIDYVRVYQ